MGAGRTAAGGLLVVGLVALAKLALHMVVNAGGGYGIFRDELYYLACADHLAWGYVDQPPLSIFLLAAQRWLLGDSLFALRLLPAVAGAATVVVIGLLARELGGGRFAQALAALASLVGLIHLAMAGFYSMNAFDLLFWALAALLLARIIKSGGPAMRAPAAQTPAAQAPAPGGPTSRAPTGQAARLWLLLGLVLGLGLLNKVSVLWLGLGIFLGLVATRERRWLKSPWPWLAGLLAGALFAPYVAWNLAHDLAHLEFIGAATAGKYSGLDALDFAAGQLLVNNPVTVPLWMAGLWFLLGSRAGRRYRLLGFVWVGALVVLLANGHSKPEYLSPAYAILFAAGGVAWEGWLAARPWRRLRPVAVGVLILGLALAPMVVPVLPVETYIAYAAALGIEPSTAESKELDELPQFYADMFGWREKAVAVAQVYHALPPEEQRKAAIFGPNYGRAGAVDHFGRELGLPPAIGGHNTYWLWGPGEATGEVVIVLGGSRESLEERFEAVELARRVPCRYCMPYEDDLPIYVCRGLRQPLAEVWPELKNFS